MFHICRGGSTPGKTKNKEHRFIPIHPKVRPLIEALPKNDLCVFPEINARKILKRLKVICKEVQFINPEQYKIHSFRHHFASLCANHQIAYKKALLWMGHSSSEILDLYYHLSDADSQAAMQSLANDTQNQWNSQTNAATANTEFTRPALAQYSDTITNKQPEQSINQKGALRAQGESIIEKGSEVLWEKELLSLFNCKAERTRFELVVGPKTYADLANRCLQPLGHLSRWYIKLTIITYIDQPVKL